MLDWHLRTRYLIKISKNCKLPPPISLSMSSYKTTVQSSPWLNTIRTEGLKKNLFPLIAKSPLFSVVPPLGRLKDPHFLGFGDEKSPSRQTVVMLDCSFGTDEKEDEKKLYFGENMQWQKLGLIIREDSIKRPSLDKRILLLTLT